MTTRRTFLRASAVAAVATVRRSSRMTPAVPASGRGLRGGPDPRSDPDMHALAMRALDAAKASGASYADVRFTVTRRRTFLNDRDLPTDREISAVGVRALAKGAWGFAAHTECTLDVVARLGSEAAKQAVVDAWPRVPPIELGDRLPATTGHWQMPAKRDPFSVPIAETMDFIQSVFSKVKSLKGGININFTFASQDRTFASTDGMYVTQTVYTSLGGSSHRNTLPSHLVVEINNSEKGLYAVPFVTPSGAGYEVVEDARILDHLPEWLDTARVLARATPFERIGQFDVVFDAAAMAAIIDGTFGAALEYDRVVGYEANAGGTSYLAPPKQLLGSPVAPHTVTLTADRTMATGVATVGWDDEGVAPRPVPLIQDGTLVDYATSREFASELAGWYHTRGVPVRSNGCAASESALTVPLVYTPNLRLHPGAKDASLEDLMADISDGLAVFGGSVEMDIQQVTGRGRGAQVYMVKNGKLGPPVTNAIYNFRSADLWRNLVALGGAKSAMIRGIPSSKGQPDQSSVHSVHAVAARFTDVQCGPADR